MLRNTSGESPPNRPIIFTQTQALAQPEENMGEQAQDLLCNSTFVQSTIHALTLAATKAFASKSQKTKSPKDIDYDKITTLEARVKAIEGANLYDLVQAVEMCLIPNVIILKS